MVLEKDQLRFRAAHNELSLQAKANGVRKLKKKYSSFNLKGGFRSSALCLISRVLSFSFLLHSLLHPVVDGSVRKENTTLYAVIFDAGSTGTRVSTYTFCMTYPHSRLDVASELFVGVSPGLAHYYMEPKKGAESINHLLETARSVIPQEFRSLTPLVLKATAGLRLLKTAEAENLLNAVRGVFLGSEFFVSNNAVEIMDGVDEGIYSWLTINILLGHVNSVTLGKETVAALDLGGGSTQVAFTIKDPRRTPSLIDFVHTVSTPYAKVDVFTHSYLNLGLHAVRHAVFTSGETSDDINYVSECLNPIIDSAKFVYKTKTYYISGKNNSKSSDGNSVVDFDVCGNLIRQRIMNFVNPVPITLEHHQIAAFGSFFSRAHQNGIVPKSGGKATVGQFVKKAKEVCATADPNKPFMCLDLAYISILLTDGYGLDRKTNIDLYKKVKDHEITWALGCAYKLLADIRRTKKHL